MFIFVRLLLPILAFGIPCSFAQDFRDFYWGASREEVKASETMKLYDEHENSISFTGTVSLIDVLCNYAFDDSNSLVSGGYSFLLTNHEFDTYANSYLRVRQILIDIYGKPNSEKILANNYLNENSEAWATWITSKTQIQLSLLWRPESIDFFLLNYDSHERAQMMKEALQEGF
jgi:hypothetical protein